MRFVDALTGRRGFAVALILLMAIADYARGLVVTPAFAEPSGFTICHGAAGGTPSGGAVNHDCCDDCVLAAAVIAPPPPEISLSVEIVAEADQVATVAVEPARVRAWTPRQAQGPPRG